MALLTGKLRIARLLAALITALLAAFALAIPAIILAACDSSGTKNDATLSDTLQSALPGDVLVFGTYSDEPLEWRVLARDDAAGRILLITEYVIEDIAYQEGGGNTNWAACSLRVWLNGEFIDLAFTSDEQRFLVAVDVSTPDNATYRTQGGTIAHDRVFCLSIEELQRYFLCMPERKTSATEHALESGVSQFDGGAHWWTRSPGRYQDNMAYVTPVGNIDLYGINVGREHYMGVRPAMWVTIAPSAA